MVHINNKVRFFIAIVMGIVCLIVFYWRFNEMQNQYQSQKFVGKTVKVLIAAEDINRMVALQKTQFNEVDIPEAFAQPGAVKDFNEIKGLLASIAIKNGTQLLSTMVTEKFEGGTSLTDHLVGDYKAYTISVDATLSMGFLVRPGDNLTILEVVPDAQGSVVPLLENIQVLAVGSIFNPTKVPEGFSYNTITLQVTPDQAKELIRAGRIRLLLNAKAVAAAPSGLPKR